MTDGEDRRIPAKVWATIVRNVPLVSVDLVVRHDGGVVLGRRSNQPAMGEWFIPGGRVLKNERLDAAAERVGREELGVEVEIVRRLGAYEHFYDVADVPDAGGKHYVPIGYEVTPLDDGFDTDDQHEEFRVFRPPFDDTFHPHVTAYLRDAGLIDD